MRKVFFLCALLTFIFTGCSNGVSQEEYNKMVAERDKYKELYESSTTDTSTEIANIEITSTEQSIQHENYLEQLDITEYSYVNSINDTVYCMVIKNNSAQTLAYNVNITASDNEGNLVGAKSIDEYAAESGQEVVLYTSFDGDKAKEFSYDLTADIDQYNLPVVSQIETKVTKLDKKVIVSCKNTSSENAKFVRATAMFFKEGKLKYINEVYCIDNKQVLGAGKTISNEINAFQEFDDVKVYITGKK